MDTDSDHDDSYGFPSQESSTETFTPTPEGSCKNCKNTDFEANSGAFYCTNCGYEEGPELVYDLYGTTSVYHGNWPENNENAINENLENLKAGDVIPQMGGEDGSSTLEKSGGSLRSQYGTLKEGSVGHGKFGGSLPIETLPDETLLNLFKFLKFKDLGRCLQVSKRFRTMALDETLWKKIKIVDQGNLIRGVDKKTVKEMKFQFVYICSLFCKTLFIRKQNGKKIFSNCSFFILFVKSGFCFKLK